MEELSADAVKVIVDNVFVLVAAVLVIFMQAGFAMVETGLTRGRDAANIVMKNMMDFCIGALIYFAFGYALMFGVGNGWIGYHNFFLGDAAEVGTLSPATFFLFQTAFAATAATIVSGAMAGRTKFKAYIGYTVFISGLIYPIFGHWMWGGGWLAERQFLDFAGSTVVHATGAWAALVGAVLVGPRLGKFGPDGRPRAIPGHSVPFAILGTFILLVGWYGFNPGSQLAADFPIVADVAVTTTLAAAAGGVMAMIATWVLQKKPDVSMSANGVLAGLVAITAGCVFVHPWAAVVIGGLAGLVVVASVRFFDRVRVDDPVGAISVHGTCGVLGTLAVGIFAAPDLIQAAGLGGSEGLLYGGGLTQLGRQALGSASNFVWVIATSAVVFGVLKATIGLRVSEEEEISGLDVAEHGVAGYGEHVIVGSGGQLTGVGSAPAATVERPTAPVG
ncbi:MAG: ammonium transporter [Acidimicrobiia bacterium]